MSSSGSQIQPMQGDASVRNATPTFGKVVLGLAAKESVKGITAREVLQATGVDRRVARSVLGFLKRQGLVVEAGKRKGATVFQINHESSEAVERARVALYGSASIRSGTRS